MNSRTIDDRLREEYFDLLPDIRLAAEQLDAEIRYNMLPIRRNLGRHERLVVTSRVKECNSALDALRRRQEGATFDVERVEPYTLTALRDLAATRVLVFPRNRLEEVETVLKGQFSTWTPDPILDENRQLLAYKRYGHSDASPGVQCEYQVVSMLTGLFWEVEHSAIYKPTPDLKGIARSLEMRQRADDVLRALRAFEDEFGRLLLNAQD